MDKDRQEKIIEKARMKMAISNFEKEDIEMKKPKSSILKMVAMFIVAIGVTGGLAYATTVISNKIWKDPESYTINKELTEEEKQKCISKEEAQNIGNEYLKKIGFSEENIEQLRLMYIYSEDEKIWEMNSEKVHLSIDAEKGIIKSVYIPSTEYTIPYNYGISRVEARKVAKELLEKYRPEDDKGEYELIKLTRNMMTDEASYIWYAIFHKKYGDLLNENEEIRIGWIPTINGLYSLDFYRSFYENNEQIITKEQAINIAKLKDNEIEKYKEIKSINAEIRIKQMNANVYLRENNKEEFDSGLLYHENYEKVGENGYQLKDGATFYKTEERVRKVWVVVIEYVKNDTLKGINSFSYYVDATTGEIIGGNRWNVLASEETIKNDPYNVIEKN